MYHRAYRRLELEETRANWLELSEMRNKIIDVYSYKNVARVRASAGLLRSKISFLNKIHLLRKYWEPDWTHDENIIIRVFVSMYMIHYIEKRRLYHDMEMDDSFLTSIALHLY